MDGPWSAREISEAAQRVVAWFIAEQPHHERVIPRVIIEEHAGLRPFPTGPLDIKLLNKWNLQRVAFYEHLRDITLRRVGRWLEAVPGEGLSLLEPDTSVATLEWSTAKAIEVAAHKAQRRVGSIDDKALTQAGREAKTSAVVRLGGLRSAAGFAAKEQERQASRDAQVSDANESPAFYGAMTSGVAALD